MAEKRGCALGNYFLSTVYLHFIYKLISKAYLQLIYVLIYTGVSYMIESQELTNLATHGHHSPSRPRKISPEMGLGRLRAAPACAQCTSGTYFSCCCVREGKCCCRLLLGSPPLARRGIAGRFNEAVFSGMLPRWIVAPA